MATWLPNVPRWLFLAALLYAPWAFGCTRPWTITILNGLLGATLLLWLAACLVQCRLPRLPPVLLGAVLYLITSAWWMALNAKFVWDPNTLEFSPRTAWLAWAPGSIDQLGSTEMAWRMTTLLGAICFVADLARDDRWCKRIVWTIVANGTSLALLGLVQRLAGAGSIFWQASDTGSTFFATYRYHSNAGSFLNLIWPLTLALLLAAIRRDRKRLALVLGGALLLCWVGLAVSGARAASLIALLLILAWSVWVGLQMKRGQLPAPSLPTALVGGGLLLFLSLAIAASVGWDVAFHRWGKAEELFSAENPRLLVYGVCLKMVPEAGWAGMGPGTFREAFPYFTPELGDRISGLWRYAHQDYLQTLIEWGYIGFLAWTILAGGAVFSAWRHQRRNRPARFSRRALQLAILTAVTGVLAHSLVDFPLQIASLQLYAGTLFGLLWAGPAPDTTRAPP